MKFVSTVELGEVQAQEPDRLPVVAFRDLIKLNAQLCQQERVDALRYLSAGDPKRGRPRTGMSWNPSGLEGCSLKSVYKAVGVKRDPVTVDFDTQFIFDRGTVMGLWMAAYIRSLEDFGIVRNVHAQVADRMEKLIVDKNLDYGGFADIVFELVQDGRLHHVEVKSKDNAEAMAKITSPDSKHDRQHNDYMVMDKAHCGWVVYMGLVEENGRQTFTMKEFPRTPSRTNWERTVREITSLQRFKAKPDRMPFKSSNPRFECPSCPFQLKCRRNLTPAQALQVQ